MRKNQQFLIPHTGDFALTIPLGASPRSVQPYSASSAVMFVEVDTAEPNTESRDFKSVLDQGSFDESGLTYIGTFKSLAPGAAHFTHVYEVA